MILYTINNDIKQIFIIQQTTHKYNVQWSQVISKNTKNTKYDKFKRIQYTIHSINLHFSICNKVWNVIPTPSDIKIMLSISLFPDLNGKLNISGLQCPYL